MLIENGYVKMGNITQDFKNKLIKLLPSHRIIEFPNVLMVKKDGVMYEIKNRGYSPNDEPNKEIIDEILSSDFKVICKHDFKTHEDVTKFFDAIKDPSKSRFFIYDGDKI